METIEYDAQKTIKLNKNTQTTSCLLQRGAYWKFVDRFKSFNIQKSHVEIKCVNKVDCDLSLEN